MKPQDHVIVTTNYSQNNLINQINQLNEKKNHEALKKQTLTIIN